MTDPIAAQLLREAGPRHRMGTLQSNHDLLPSPGMVHEDWGWDDDNYWKLANEDYRETAADIIEGWEA